MNYKSLLTTKEKVLLLVSKLPWRFKKLCPGYLRELDKICVKIIKQGGIITTFHGKLKVEFQGFKYNLRVGSTDFLVFDQVILEKEYQPIVDLVKARNKNFSKLNIIDAGANVGFTSLFFSEEFENSIIVSLEPDQNNFIALNDNISINNKIGKIIPMQAGIWGKDAEMVLDNTFRDGREWAKSLVEANESSSVDFLIRGYSLQTILLKTALEKIDLLKIDIEGGEKNLFDEWSLSDEVFKLIKFIAIEIHDEIADRNFINKLLISNNFEIIEIGETTFGVNKNLV
ncbi:MAG: FkbM family methyltransferase [Bacteroidota bacterium]|nr:FkbM family methyltransferase [Bacteroidota bacterium]